MAVGDRFQIIQGGFLPIPAACITCGSPSRDCVWFGAMNMVHIPSYEEGMPDRDTFGSVLICTLCFKSAVETNPGLGFITNEDHMEAMDELRASQTKDVSKLGRIDKAIADFHAAVADAGDAFSAAIALDNPDVVGVEPLEDEKPAAKSGKPAKVSSTLGDFGIGDWAK